MKRINLIPLSIISLIAAVGVMGTGRTMLFLWGKVLEGEPLPDLTIIGTKYGFIIPLIFSLISFISHFKIEDKKRLLIYEIISSLEIIYLSFIGFTYFIPLLKITWSM
jgi:hypothetical protein